MNMRRAVCMSLGDVESLGRLRLHAGIKVIERADSLWLHIQRSSDDMDDLLRMLPGQRFTVLPDEQLVPDGKIVPTGNLPSGEWIDLPRWLHVAAPMARFSGQLSAKVELRLVRGGPVRESNLLVTDIASWQKYAVAAAQIRLKRWSFAMNEAGDVLVRGTPLPPIQGVRFVEESGVAIAAGWTCAPPVAASVLADLLELETGDLALLQTDGQWSLISEDSFVRATRSAVRLSAEGLAGD